MNQQFEIECTGCGEIRGMFELEPARLGVGTFKAEVPPCQACLRRAEDAGKEAAEKRFYGEISTARERDSAKRTKGHDSDNTHGEL